MAVQAAVLLAMAPHYGPHRDELYFVSAGRATRLGLPGPAVLHAAPGPPLHRARRAQPGGAPALEHPGRRRPGAAGGAVLPAARRCSISPAAHGGDRGSECGRDDGRPPAVDGDLRHARLDRGPRPGHPGAGRRPAEALAGRRRGGRDRTQQQARGRVPAPRHPRRARPRPGRPSGAAHAVAVARRLLRCPALGAQPDLAVAPRLAGPRPVRRHRRGVRRHRRPSGHGRRGVLDVQPVPRGAVGHRPRPAAASAGMARGPAAGVRLPGRDRGVPGDRGQGLLPRRGDRPAACRGLHLAGRAVVRPGTRARGRRPRRLRHGRLAGAGAGPAGADVRGLVLHRASTTTRPRRSAGRSTPMARSRGRSSPASPTASWSSPATTARPARSSGTAWAAPVFSGHNGWRDWGPPLETSVPVVVVGYDDPAADFTGCERAAHAAPARSTSTTRSRAGRCGCATGPSAPGRSGGTSCRTTTREPLRSPAGSVTRRGVPIGRRARSTGRRRRPGRHRGRRPGRPARGQPPCWSPR